MGEKRFNVRSKAALRIYRNVLEDRLLFLNVRDRLLQVC